MHQTFCLLFFLALSATLVAQPSADGWQISTSQRDDYTGIVAANGRIGILPSPEPFGVKQVILNNVYDKESPLGVSRVLEGMNFGNLEMKIDGQAVTGENLTDWRQTLDMKEAKFRTTFTVPGKARITYDIYALRNLQYAAYIDVSVEALAAIEVTTTGRIEVPKDYQFPSGSFRVLKDLETTMPILQMVATSRLGRHRVATSATFIWHDINSGREHQRPELTAEQTDPSTNMLTFTRKVKPGKTLDFAWTAAQCTTQDFGDPQTETERFVIYNLLTPRADLLAMHRQRWADLWRGDIIIEGAPQDQADVRLALYHLYAFSRADSDLSISPMGLSSQGYNGHIFWDTELWMFPPLLVLNQPIARSLVNYRSDRLEPARAKARNFGFAGAMFPWESDDTGEEATPAWALTGTFEHHITADVAIAFWNFYRVTRDEHWLRERGYPLLREVADYWVSRATENKDGSYSIKNVVGANEFAANIDDNAFTNGSAITALRYAVLAARELNQTPDPRWAAVADKIIIHQFPDGTTRENATYDGEVIKQADANLLAYPLDIVSDKERLLKDLRYYEPKLSPEGPAMAQAVFSVLYARLGDAEEAYRLFKAGYVPNQRPPFGALSESPTSNNPYFATGAGGLLQSVLFGFAGLHLTDEGIVQKNPVLPKAWKSLTITGVGSEGRTIRVDE